jgi:hypothetical protein
MQIEADGEAARVRTIEQARADMEQVRIAIYRDLSAHVLLGLAARELAGKLTKIDHLNVSPDLVGTVLRELGKSADLPGRSAPA